MTGPPPPRGKRIARSSCDCISVTSRARCMSVGAGVGSSLAGAHGGNSDPVRRVVSAA